ncbi:hypothetical protein FZI85_13000 [Mycobacterium sp. CBMA293]|uniref:hypothetical protein n=1 Tax=unclassified Mycolicibacterium TaxID=2636767 RepID=UPI0012DF9B93|nr:MULTISPECIES: hypothetical protein [unclassified Mycolicibacterium]MUL47467.1 hypothetical protein [Mycolicibacterium sp. CBMA 360]MUL59453.1 hypothetical protein [Mycolicibacterium sp. CBMA 335]MUL71178.1 hypothetical protein [Mycolicibacterium sp. CBMA 311]MUL94821.1 hypothetical protein [Mycolicibacterium sp. CBMA 230]MUM03662.1 hypothetical protein [Mycolicibacterium sp. CBMA 213]
MKHAVAAAAMAGALIAGVAWLPAPQAHAEGSCVPLDGSPMVVTRNPNTGIGKKLDIVRTYTYSDGMVNWTIHQDGGIKDNTGLGFGATINQIYIPELDSNGSVPGNPGDVVNIDSWHFHTHVRICDQ